MKHSNDQIKGFVLEGLCIKCFYSTVSEDRERFYCDKFKIRLEGVVERCGGHMPISEGLDQLVAKMKANGELPKSI